MPKFWEKLQKHVNNASQKTKTRKVSFSLCGGGGSSTECEILPCKFNHWLTSCKSAELASFFFFFFHLTYSRWTSSLPSCLWSQRIFPSLPGSRLTIFLSRCKFSTLTARQPMVEFYLLTFPRFPLRKKEHKSYFGKNRTHDFRTSRCAAYLLDHSGDEHIAIKNCKA